MATTRDKERIRFRYGICLNDNCEKCKSKEIQEIPTRKDFICQNPECGKPLRECPPPKKGGNAKLLGVIAAVAVIIAVAAGVFLLGGKEDAQTETEPVAAEASIAEDNSKAESKQSQQNDSIVADTLTAGEENTATEEQTQQEKAESTATLPATQQETRLQTSTSSATSSSSSTKDLGYAIFRGQMKNGQPGDVNGRMEFRQRHQIDSRDPKKRIAEVGDYVIGEYSEGHLVQGIWYGADNQVKGSIIIGK
ncbi:MAG: hypothetical protein Q4D30_11330 [Bacteroidales bacterium]|nr:hypothetical protein [Bacteroidales bacterium]